MHREIKGERQCVCREIQSLFVQRVCACRESRERESVCVYRERDRVCVYVKRRRCRESICAER